MRSKIVIAFFLVIAMLKLTSCTKTSPTPTSSNCQTTVACQNNSTCRDDTCSCTFGFEGSSCQTASRYRYIGTFAGFTVRPNNTPPNYTPDTLADTFWITDASVDTDIQFHSFLHATIYTAPAAWLSFSLTVDSTYYSNYITGEFINAAQTMIKINESAYGEDFYGNKQ